MGIGAPGTESFERAIVRCRNQHIAVLLAPLVIFRQEVCSNDQLRDRGGIDNTTRDHFLKHLINCDRVRRRVTYNPAGEDLKAIIAKSIDTKEVIDSGENPLGGDNVQGQSGGEFDIPYAFDGSDPNFPPRSQIQMTAPTGILLLNGIDIAIVQATRLESRHRTKFITVMDSMRIYGNFQQLHEYLVAFGGDENRVDVTNPLPVDEPLGPQSSANRIAPAGS